MFIRKLRLLGMDTVISRLDKIKFLVDAEDLYNKESKTISSIIALYNDNIEDMWFSIILLIYRYLYDTESNMRIAIYKMLQCSFVGFNFDNIRTHMILMIDKNYETIDMIKLIIDSTPDAVKYCMNNRGILGYKEHKIEYSRNLEDLNNKKIYENFGITNLLQLRYNIPEISVRYKNIADSMNKKQREFVGTYSDIILIYDIIINFRDEVSEVLGDNNRYELQGVLGSIVTFKEHKQDVHKKVLNILNDDELWKKTIDTVIKIMNY